MNILPIWVKPLAILLLVAAVIGGGLAYHHHVYQLGYAAAVAERQADDDAKLAKDTATAHKKELALQAQVDQNAIERQQEKASHEKELADIRADARRGNSGLRAPAARLPADPARPDSGAASRPVAETGFVLLPETAESVLDAAADLRQGVLDRNALIDAYNACRAASNSE